MKFWDEDDDFERVSGDVDAGFEILLEGGIDFVLLEAGADKALLEGAP